MLNRLCRRSRLLSLLMHRRQRRRYNRPKLMSLPIRTSLSSGGFVDMADYMPRHYTCDTLKGDQAIVNAARISYEGHRTKKTAAQNRQLIRYLMRHQHSSPFEMVEFKFHVRAPLFVLRQWYRHRTFSYNEVSARYTQVGPDPSDDNDTLDKHMFVPDTVRAQSAHNIQSSEGQHGNEALVDIFKIASVPKNTYNAYKFFLGQGVPREQARMLLPQNMMTEIYVKGNLKNWLHFIKLRTTPGAQEEIRVYADAVYQHIRRVCPISTEAFEDFQRNTVTFNRQELKWIQKHPNITMATLLTHTKETFQNNTKAKSSGLSKGERREFLDKLTMFCRAKMNDRKNP